MSKVFNVKLNGVSYNENNIPKEIKLNGKDDVLSIFDSDEDGTLSKEELKKAILSFLNEEKNVSKQFADGNISDEEAGVIARHFKNGMYKIGENIQKLIKELQNRITKQNYDDKFANKGYSQLFEINYRGQACYVQDDGKVVNKDGEIIKDLFYDLHKRKMYLCRTNKLNDQGQGEKYMFDLQTGKITSIQAVNYKGERYSKENYSAKVLGLKKESTESFIGSLKNKIAGKEDSYVYSRTAGVKKTYSGKNNELEKIEELKNYYEWDGEKFVFIGQK